jgi:cytoskeleton protein RodZ
MDQARQATGAAFSVATAGVLLKAAREARGLHIGALAVMLKVPVHKLEALEADRLEVLADVVFTRALAASVCRALKIDANPILAALPHLAPPRLKTDELGLNTPFNMGRGVLGLQFKNRLASPLGLAGVVLLLGILLLAILPVNEMDEVAPPLPTAVVADTPVPQVVLPVEPVATTASAPAVLQLQSRGSSWVEITDGQGVLQLRKMLAPGEQVHSQGPLPLLVVLGRADDVTVSVRGQPLDVTAMTKANVARFEVK